MNTKNNRRRQATRERIETLFVELLQTRELSQISVSDICKLADINRSTFYANYADIYELADTIRQRLETEVQALYGQPSPIYIGLDYTRLFRHIRDNQLFYSTYFKLGYDSRHQVDLGSISGKMDVPEAQLSYHVEFHKAGLNAIIKKWLASGCAEAPETMVQIIRDEYTNRR